MFGALKGLLQVLQDDATVSSYELQSTGLVTALLRCLHQVQCIIENKNISFRLFYFTLSITSALVTQQCKHRQPSLLIMGSVDIWDWSSFDAMYIISVMNLVKAFSVDFSIHRPTRRNCKMWESDMFWIISALFLEIFSLKHHYLVNRRVTKATNQICISGLDAIYYMFDYTLSSIILGKQFM